MNETIDELRSLGALINESGGIWVAYWINESDEIHRLDGPAVITSKGHYLWMINGVRYYNVNAFCKASNASDETKMELILRYDSDPNEVGS